MASILLEEFGLLHSAKAFLPQISYSSMLYSIAFIWSTVGLGVLLIKIAHGCSNDLRDYKANIIHFYVLDPTVWHGVKNVLVANPCK